MTQANAERPTFFEGQYLGAEDLTALVTYFREQNARQTLGQHSWGIAIGLDLVETTAADGSLDVFVQPGLAFDGYGRLIVVSEPARLDGAQFAGAASGEVEVWIRFVQNEREGVRKGFEVCAEEDVFARVDESFIIEVGPRNSILERQSGVNINGLNVLDARDALRQINPDAPLICDGSIPHQEFPDDDNDALWLLPLGHIHWQGGIPGSFQPLTDEQRIRSRRKRRYVGVIAESLLAADGLIRLRNRHTPHDQNEVIDTSCSTIATQSTDFYLCESELLARELIWLEGDTRVTGDVRLFGSRLEFREPDGRDFITRTVDGVEVPESTALLLQRNDVNTKNGVDLQVLLGASDDGRNRLSIGRSVINGTSLCDLEISGEDQIVFQDDGKVGIGAVDTLLESPLTIRGIDEQSQLMAFENAASNRLWQVNMGPEQDSINIVETIADASRLTIASGGHIGMGTDIPDSHLHIKSDNPSLFLDINDTSPNHLTRLQFGRDGTSTSSIYWSKSSQKITINNEGVNALVIDQEKVGLGTNQPATTLHIATGNDVNLNDSSGYFVVGTTGGLNLGLDRNEIQARDNNNRAPLSLQHSGGDLNIHAIGTSRFTVKHSGNTGIGTNNPSAKLDVRGDIKLGSTGALFAPGGVENLRIIVGTVSTVGNLLQGDGYNVIRTSVGRYTINFDTAFQSLPVIVLTLVNHDDSVASVHATTNIGFNVHIQDVEGNTEVTGIPESASFNFIVMGER